MSTARYYEDMFLKPAITAGVGAVAAKMLLFPEFNNIYVFGSDMPLWAVTAAALYTAGVLGEVVQQVVLPHIDRTEKFNQSMIGGLLQPGVVGAANTGVWLIANSAAAQQKGIIPLFAIGAASEVAADYIYNHFVTPML